MITRVELANYLHTYLECDKFNDYAPNGLQIEGGATIRRICTAVTASEHVIQQASEHHADALIVHHGFFWRGESPVICGIKKQRIGHLILNNINLFAYHLPLDGHPVVGNNACLGELFGAHSIQPHSIGLVPNLLWSGELQKPFEAQALAKKMGEIFKRVPLHVAGTDRLVQRIAWCSGAAQDYIEDAHRLGVDAYISGEISERTFYQAKELGMHYFSCGHHATERFGVQSLGKHLSESFGLHHEFIDSHNPI